MGHPFSSLQVFNSDLGSTVLRNVTNWISGEELRPDVDPSAVQDRYNRQRDSVRSQAAGLGFQGEFRPREVLDADEFEKHDVATLRQKVDQIGLAAVNDLIASWNNIADRNNASLTDFTNEMARGTDESVWRGAARDAAAIAVRDYTAQGAQVTNAARLTSGKLAELRTGLEPTVQLVPHAPEHRSGVDNARSWVAGRGWRNDDVAEHNAKAEALRVLRTVYAPVVMESDTNVPVIPRPVPVTDPGGPNPSGPNPGITNTGNGNPSGTPSPGSNPPGTNPADNPATPSSTQSTDDSAGTPQSTSTDPTSTTPASTTPASTTTPGTPGSPNVSTPGSPGNPGSPTGPGSPGVSVPPQGRPTPGTTNTPGANPAARSGSPSGRPGMGGMPGGMAPGARGGKSDDESSKGIPDYLITQEHGNELTGLDDLPRTVPPVIGDNQTP
ncbi:hypothetical protein OHA40_22700 [Nocardia sp. NBC_00508]|uniref:hypothetical protein n=1 Tax=Nocardia sp. NBC_00508 TaxID=2975992 RepID=UPI002E7FB514|nr:hypothetical protein [Nocardia sp. NBC_00508]WUD64487.1 hypothetical protein OHA40_22700 [Nocardia sp. NBC_00508]